MKKRAAVVAVSVVAAAAVLTGCDPGPECVKSHGEMTLVPIWTGKTTTIQPVWTDVCDEYAKETKAP